MKSLTGIGLSQLPAAAKEVIAAEGERKLWIFRGEMGAGKTTFIQALCKELGVKETVSSPTFSLVNEYRDAAGNKIFHFDFYRIRSIEEVYDIGYEDYFYSGNLCLIEWPEKIDELLQGEHVYQINILRDGDTRTIQFENVLI